MILDFSSILTVLYSVVLLRLQQKRTSSMFYHMSLKERPQNNRTENKRRYQGQGNEISRLLWLCVYSSSNMDLQVYFFF